jgi:hypothetical protein
MASFFPSFASIDLQLVGLVAIAFLAGVLNAVAGGGSFLLFPAMLGTGMPPVAANATNTVALWPGQLTSVAAYWPMIRRNLRLAAPMALAGLIGGAAGAVVLLSTPQMTFLHLVPWLLLTAATIFAVSGPVTRHLDGWKARRRERPETGSRRPHVLLVFLSTTAICFYIGYFGAGAGF